MLKAKLIYTHGIIKQKTVRSGNGYNRDAFMVGKLTYGGSVGFSTLTGEKTLYYGADIAHLEHIVE